MEILKNIPLSIQSMILMKFRIIFETYRSNLLIDFKNLNEQERHIINLRAAFMLQS